MTTHPHKLAIGRAERARRQAARDAHDLDPDALAAQIKALPVFRDCPRPIRATRVVVVYSAYQSGGRAHGNRMVRIRVHSHTKTEWFMNAILHELVHAALPERTVHDERFRRTLARAAFEMWGIFVDPNPKGPHGRVPRYGVDASIETELRRLLDAGLEYPRLPTPTPEFIADERARRRRDLVAKRVAHAATMLRRAERRLKIAKTVERRWRQKVQRYEKIAAKRGDL